LFGIHIIFILFLDRFIIYFLLYWNVAFRDIIQERVCVSLPFLCDCNGGRFGLDDLYHVRQMYTSKLRLTVFMKHESNQASKYKSGYISVISRLMIQRGIVKFVFSKGRVDY